MSTTLDELADETTRAFERRFGRAPRRVAFAPGRVNLIGEHTDYNEGYVLPFAIDRWAVVAAGAAAGAASRLWSVDRDEEVTADMTAPLAPIGGSFADYLLGVAAGFADRGCAVPNLDLALHGNVPIGAGLGSSAAIEVAMAALLQGITRSSLDPLETARLCRRAEHAFAATPCGIMDMLVAAAAREGHALLIDCRTEGVRPVPLPGPEEALLLVVDTQVRHELAESDYAKRRQACSAAAAAIGVDSLRDADLPAVARASLGDEEACLCRHVIEENQRTLLAAAALATGDLEALGALMFQSHESLRDLYRVSCPELDAVVDAASALRGSGGVLGCRMTGGGFGGCAVALVRPHEARSIQEALSEHFASRFRRKPGVFCVHAVGGAGLVSG
jgi:galactokinase